jgi:OTU domain-containing protein 6
MEELQARHRKEQRDLVARVTQKKKNATKKTRKGVNDECAALEQELKEKQEQELRELNGEAVQEDGDSLADSAADNAPMQQEQEAPTDEMNKLSMKSQSNGTHTPQEDKKPKKNRQKERMARRAAEQQALADQAAAEAASLPDMKAQEREQMQSHFAKHGLVEKEIRADGHCLYSAIADQLEQNGLDLTPRINPKIKIQDDSGDKAKTADYKIVRGVAADYIESNEVDFAPFLEEPLFTYVHKVRDTGEWGGHMELLALAKTYGVAINVLHADGRVDKIEPDTKSDKTTTIWLGYYRHGFGLGEHYNSLRKIS